ncbi:MAG: hypothetical protein O2779_01990 [Nanoarchaeota archaeon]|nr:hypothetical protein [Nanoarchaeota archaeon]
MSLKHRLEELFLLGIVLLQISDFLEFLPEDLDFAKKLLSWAILGYLFYKASITHILFGNKKRSVDIIILLAYVLFIVKNVVAIAHIGAEHAEFFHALFAWIVNNTVILEKYAFIAAGAILLTLSLVLATTLEIKKNSFMAIIHEEGPPKKTVPTILHRFTTIFLALVGFFILVFNLATEWLAIAIDAPLAMFGILFYFFIIIRYHKHFNTSGFLHKIGNMGESFYEKFLEMIANKKTVLLALMGLLALHALTDVANFFIPYLIGIKDALYFEQLGPNHTSLIYLFLQDIQGQALLTTMFTAIIYLGNLIAMFFFLVLPTFIWYRFFNGRLIHVAKLTHAAVVLGLVSFITFPLFKVQKIDSQILVGADFITRTLTETTSWLQLFLSSKTTAITIAALAILSITFTIYILESIDIVQKEVFLVAVLAGLSFFGYYIYLFFADLSQYYFQTIGFLAASGEYFITFFFVIFWLMNCLLYVGGYLLFVKEIIHRHLFIEEKL